MAQEQTGIQHRRPKWRAFVAVVGMVAAAAVGIIAAAPASHGSTPGVTGYQVIASPIQDITGPATASTSVSCPTGQSVVGGGVSSHSPLTYINASYPADASTWDVRVTLPVNVGYPEQFTAYAVCVDTSSVPGLTVAASGPFTVGGGATVINGVQCASGSVALDGGISSSDSGVALTESTVLDGEHDIWLVGGSGAGGAGGSFGISAVCVPLSDLSDYTAQTTHYGDYGTLLDQPISGSTALTNTAGTPYCPSGDVAVGAGAVVHDQANSYVSSLVPAPGGDAHYWLATSTDANPPTQYTESAEANSICVNAVQPIATTTTLSISPTSPGLNQLVTLTATVTPASGTAVPAGTVEFYDNGVLIGTGTVNGSGVATMSYRFGAGSHSLVAKYLGDTVDSPGFLPSQSSPLTFSITCTTTITGTHGAFTASSGLTCVSNAHITGGVTVVNGAQLDVENSTISGGVTLSSSGAVRFCGSTLSSLTVAAAKGYVMIGDPNSACAGNTIKGGVTIVSNKGGGSLVNNTISGGTTVSGNTPAWTVSGNHA